MNEAKWDALTDKRYNDIWSQIRAALNPGRRKSTEQILDCLSPEETAALFHRLCHGYGYAMKFGNDSNRKEKILNEFEITLDLMQERHQSLRRVKREAAVALPKGRTPLA